MTYRHSFCLLVIIIAVALVMPTNIRAQDQDTASDKAPDKAPPYAGTWGIQLQISDMFQDPSTTGTRILVKRMGGRYAGFRLGAGLGVNWADDDTVDSTGGDQVQTNSYMFDFSAEMLFHPIRGRSVQPYFGFGVLFGYSNFSAETNSDRSELSGSATGFGGILTLGGEWYAVDRFSLYAEYGLQLMSWKYSSEYTAENAEDMKRDRTQGGLSTRNVVLGVSFYF